MSIRLTKKRTQILDVLKAHHGTLSAGEIHTKLPKIDLVTIYRNLDLFVKEKIIKQVYLGTDEARYEFQHRAHHHAVCTHCEKVIHFTVSETQMKKLLRLPGFRADDIEVTVRGVCSHKKK